jgi:hypothetical protein
MTKLVLKHNVTFLVRLTRYQMKREIATLVIFILLNNWGLKKFKVLEKKYNDKHVISYLVEY